MSSTLLNTQEALSKFTISEFYNKFDNKPKQLTLSWEQFVDKIKHAQIRANKNGIAFAPATFRNRRRTKENAIEVTLLVLDVDHNANLEKEIEHCKKLGYQCLLYTTHSHTEQEHRFRVVLRLKTPIPADQYPKLWLWAAKKWPNIDPAPKDPSRLYFYSALKTKDAPFYAEAFDGDPLDWTSLPLEVPQHNSNTTRQEFSASSHKSKGKSAYIQAALDGEVSRVRSSNNGERNATLNKAAFALAQLLHTGLIDEGTIEAQLEQAALSTGLLVSEIRPTIGSGIEAGRKQPRIIPNPHLFRNSQYLMKSNSSAQVDELKQRLKKIPAHSIVSNVLKSNYQDHLTWDVTSQQWMSYTDDSGVWQSTPTEIISNIMQENLVDLLKEMGWHDGINATYLSGVMKLLQGHLAVIDWQEKPHLLPLKNGVLDLQTKILLAHSPNYHLTWSLPYSYDPSATCEPIQAWLLESTRGDTDVVGVLRAYLKALVTGRTDLQCFLELIGQGGTGKSTYTRLAMALVGSKNTVSTTLVQLEQNRFEVSNLHNKRLIVITDSEKYSGSISTLKAITGQDLLRFERKFENARNDFVCGAMVIIASNEPISSNDYTSGLERRRRTIPFRNAVASHQRRNLIEFREGTVEGEFVGYLPGLLNWVLDMPDAEMEALLKNTDALVPSLMHSKFEAIINTNPLAAWLEDCVIYDPNSITKIGIATKSKNSSVSGEYLHNSCWLYANYCTYAAATGNKQISLNRFSALLEDFCNSQLKLVGVSKIRKGTGVHFTGLRIRTSQDTDPTLIIGKLLLTDANTNDSKRVP